MKVLIIDNTLPEPTVSGWKVNGEQKLQTASPGEEHFVLASSGDAAHTFSPAPTGWLVTWHSGSNVPAGIRGRQFSHDPIHPVYSSGLGALLAGVNEPTVPVGDALHRLVFCLLDVETAFLQKSIRALSTLYRDIISNSLLKNLPDIKSDHDGDRATICTNLCSAFDVLENGSASKNKIEKRCKEFRDSLCQENQLEQLASLRDFLLGSVNGSEGIVQEIKSLVATEGNRA